MASKVVRGSSRGESAGGGFIGYVDQVGFIGYVVQVGCDDQVGYAGYAGYVGCIGCIGCIGYKRHRRGPAASRRPLAAEALGTGRRARRS